METIFHEQAKRVSVILFSTRENKRHISETAVKCSVYYVDALNDDVSGAESTIQILAKFKHLKFS